MNKSHWILVAFVATMVCNGSCRPREVDVKNIYPVYRSEKQLEPETPNRYEKLYKGKPDDGSVLYHRIDIPYKTVNGINAAGELAVKNNSKSVIDYVPVALTIKKPNIKVWPSDQNGIESSDDLSLYNVYTNNINPLNTHHMTTPGYNLDFHYTSHSKPSILILEEVTTRRPFYDYDSVYTQPIQVLDRPPASPVHVYYPPSPPVYRPDPQPVYHPDPEPSEPPEYPLTIWQVYRPTEPSSTEPPKQYLTTQSTTTETLPPTETLQPETPTPVPPPTTKKPKTTTKRPKTTTRKPETTTKKRKNTRCPNVSVSASTVINNSNSIKKEGCQDINIHINTDVSNSNSGLIVPGKPSNSVLVVTSRPTNSNPGIVISNYPANGSPGVSVSNYPTNNNPSVVSNFPPDSSPGVIVSNRPPSSNPPNSPVVVQNEPITSTGLGFGVFDLIWSIFSRIFNFSFLGHISGGHHSSPLSTLFTGLSAFFLPWIFPHLLLYGLRSRRLKRFTKRNELGPVEHFSGFSERNDFKNWGPRKKISSSPLPTTETEVKSEPENANKTNGKLNIESIATVARASNDAPPMPSPTALGHMLDTVSQLVESDIRTPPKLKEIIKEKANEHRKDALGENSTPLPYTFIYDDEISRFEERHEATDTSLLLDSSEGKASNTKVKVSTDEGVKGIAIPVVMDDDYDLTTPPKKLQKIPEVPKPAKDDKKKTAVTKTQPTTTPSSGLSTWILLSDNKEVTTPSPKKNNNKKEDDKKKVGVTTTTKKPAKTQSTTQKSVTQANKKVTTKPASKKPETDASGMSALEAMVKNQKKGGTTTSKPKTTESKKKVTDRLEIAETKDRIEIELIDSKPIHTLPPNLQVSTMDDKSVTAASSQNSAQSATESSVEGTTKKKSSTKKKKKNKNRKKKPADDTAVEAKIPSQPVGSQIYNFLSREIVPTVGLGLIGVALTAGLASFLGYNPFGSSTIPLRRTYDSHYPQNYYSYNTDYGGGGQSEEVLLREVLSGMPEESRYGLTHGESTYPDAYNRPEQMYDNVKNPTYPTATMYNSEKDVGNYDAVYPQDYSTGYGTNYDSQDKKYPEVKEKYPVYTRETGTSFVYPETTGMTSAEKASRVSEDYPTQSSTGEKYGKTNPDTIERQPEALYRVASESELQYRNKESTVQSMNNQNSWHRIGSPMETKKSYPVLEPGPRSLDLSKEPKKRSKRAAESVIQRISRKRTKKANDVENEIDFEDSFSDSKFSQQNDLSTSTTTTRTTTTYTETTTTDVSTTTGATPTTEEVKDAGPTEANDSYEAENDSTAAPPSSVSVLDVLKRLAQFKLRLGLNFLRSTTDIFSRYLDDIQRRVDESFANTTTTTVQYNRRKNPWSRLFFSRLNDDDDSYRRKRSVLEENQFVGAMLTDEEVPGRNSKSTKKDLRLSDKVFHQKKNSPKKFESKRTN